MQLIEEQIFEEVNRDLTSDKFILKNVKLIGVKSDNQRKYPIEVLMEAKDLYHDVPVYLGHKNGQKRNYTERVGVIKNPHCKDTGIYGELHLNPFHTQSPSIQWDYEHNSKRVGMSHDAEGETKNGIVKKLIAIHSVDLVTEAATCVSLREEVDELLIIKNQLTELNTKMETFVQDNKRLTEQIEDLKARKPITSGAPSYEPEKVQNISDWVKNLRKV